MIWGIYEMLFGCDGVVVTILVKVVTTEHHVKMVEVVKLSS